MEKIMKELKERNVRFETEGAGKIRRKGLKISAKVKINILLQLPEPRE